MASNTVYHPGTVVNINDHEIEVMILSTSACAACHAKKMCTIADMKEKTITLPRTDLSISIGEKVDVVMKESLGMYAVLLAYIFPVLILFAVIALSILISISEPLTGLIIMVLLTAYFLILYVFRNKLRKKFSFFIEKSSS